MNKENKNDPFLNAITGTIPIKKSNKNYKPVENLERSRERKNKNKPEIKPQPLEKKKTYKEEGVPTRLEIEQSKVNKKLKKGAVNINRKIDFHGFTTEEAKIKFLETVETCFFTNKRCILFITGKGTNISQNTLGKKRLYYGKIRNEFLNWVHNKKISSKILSVEQAGPKHGGAGAFFVYLRKNKI